MYNIKMKKKIIIKSNKLKELLKKGGRKNAKNDFFELLKRSVLNKTKST